LADHDVEADSTIDNAAIGARIEENRKKKDLSREDLALISNVSASRIGRIERGELDITLRDLEGIMRGLETGYDELVHGYHLSDPFAQSNSVIISIYRNLDPASKKLVDLNILNVEKHQEQMKAEFASKLDKLHDYINELKA